MNKFGLLKKPFIWVIANQIILSLGAVGIIVILSSFLDSEAFGGIRFLAAILAVFAFFSLPGMGSVIMKDTIKLTRQGLIHTILTQLRWGFGATIGGIVVCIYYFIQGNTDLAYAFLIGSMLAPFANLYLMPGLVFAGLKRFKAKTVVDFTIILCILSGAALGAWLTQSIAGTTLFYFGIQSAVTFIVLWFVLTTLPDGQSTPEEGNLVTDIKYGKQLTLFQIPFVLLPSLEKVVVFLLLGPTALAVFVITTIPAEHAKNALRNLLQFYILPHIEEEKVHLNVSRWLSIALAMTAISMIALVVFILFFLPILFPAYKQVSSFALFLILGLIPLPMQIFTLLWIALKRTKTLLIYAYVYVVIDIILFLTLSLLLDLKGAIIAKVIVEFLGMILIWILHARSRSDVS